MASKKRRPPVTVIATSLAAALLCSIVTPAHAAGSLSTSPQLDIPGSVELHSAGSDGEAGSNVKNGKLHNSSPMPREVEKITTYVNTTTRSVIDVKNHGTAAKWKFLNQCTAAKKRTCSVGRTYTVSATIQTALNVSAKVIGSSIGVTAGSSTAVNVSCSVKGPRTVKLYASATKKTNKVRTIRTYGPPTKLKREVKTSKTLTAYKPNGKYVCS